MRCSRCERTAWMNRAWRRSSHQPLSRSRRQTRTLYPGAQHRGAFSCLETDGLNERGERQTKTGSLAAPAHTPLALGLSVVERQLDRWPCPRDASLSADCAAAQQAEAGHEKSDIVNPPRVHGSRALQKLLSASHSQTPATCCRSLAFRKEGGGPNAPQTHRRARC